MNIMIFKDIDFKDSKMWVSVNFYLFIFNFFIVFFIVFSFVWRLFIFVFNSLNCWVKWVVKDCYLLFVLWFGIFYIGFEFNFLNFKLFFDFKSDLKVFE